MHKKKPIALKIILMAIVMAIPVKILTHMITDMDLKKKGSSKLIANEKTYYLPEQNGKFIELTSAGDIYEHNFREKTKCIQKDTNIIFIKDSEDYTDYDRRLIIKKNGDIYISLNHDYKGKKIGNVKGAISGGISRYHIVILTDNGEIYMFGDNEYGSLGIEHVEKLNKFTRVENIPKARKVVCDLYYTLFLTVNDELYGCGKLIQDKYYTFRKFNVPNGVEDIDCFGRTVVAQDKKGYIYELGYDLYDVTSLKTYKSFNRINEVDIVNSISMGESFFTVISQDKNIYYWGEQFVGKASGIPIKGTIKGVKNVKNIFCCGRYIYLLTNKKIIRYKLK